MTPGQKRYEEFVVEHYKDLKFRPWRELLPEQRQVWEAIASNKAISMTPGQKLFEERNKDPRRVPRTREWNELTEAERGAWEQEAQPSISFEEHTRARHEALKTTNVRRELGKIKSLRIGMGGYQNAQFGVSIELGGESWSVGDFKGFWSPSRTGRSEYTKWTEAERQQSILDAFLWLDLLMKHAEVDDAMKLVGKPVEVTFEGNMLKSWRILTEVI